MKILYCVNDISNSGGIERLLEIKANYFIKNFNYDVTILTWEQKEEVFYNFDKQVKIINMNAKYYNNSFQRQIEKIKKTRTMQKLLKKEKYDYVISCSYPLDIFISLFKKYSYFIKEIHISKWSMYQNLTWKQRLLLKFTNDYALKSFNKVITLTKEDLKEWNLENIDCIHNPLTFYPKIFSSCGNKKIITVGRLEKQKGYDILIDVWNIIIKKYPTWVLEIYGEGSERGNLQNKINKLGLENSFLLKGTVKNIQDKYLESSMYVMSSRSEGMPMVLLEAMACGLPVVSFDCPCGPKEIIKDNEDGFIVKFGDVEQMAERIEGLIFDEEKRKLFGKNARKNIQKFSQDKIMNQWKELLENNIGVNL